MEGPRVVRGIATYDPAGKKIDAVDYPGETDSLPGKETYRYDSKGNIVEKVVLGSDSSILSKESYEYEFDQLGNWTRMNSFIAVYENGKISFEPTAVTYRTISYYYTQAIEKLSSSESKTKGAAPRYSQPPIATSINNRTAISQPGETNQPVAELAAADAKDSAKPSPVASTQTQSTDTVAGDPTATSTEVNTTPTNASTPHVIKVAEDVMRNAAMDLPQPEYPVGALPATNGRVEVQLLVDEKGQVTNARAMSGNSLLRPAAEAAALKARFSPAKLSADAAIVFGTITYDFTLPGVSNAAASATNPTTASGPPTPDERKPVIARDETAALVKTEPKAANTESATSLYKKGLSSLALGHYEAAAEAFNRALLTDPNDAMTYVKLAMSYSGMHKHKEAIASYKMASQINQIVLDAPAYYMWGGSYLALDKTSEAISAFKQAISINRAETIDPKPKKARSFPSQDQLHDGLGIAYMNAKRFRDAIDEFKQAVAINPANADANFGLAMAYLAKGDRKAAENQNKILSLLDHGLAQKVAAALDAPPNSTLCLTLSCRR